MADKRKNGGNTIAIVRQIADLVAKEQNVLIWDLEFVKEGVSWFLRIYIDRPEGITVEDCENFSRAIDPRLDEIDPIDQAYYLEVSSPGVERELKRKEHFTRMEGEMIRIRLIRPLCGRKELVGKLVKLDDRKVVHLAEKEKMEIPLSDIAWVKLVDTTEFIEEI